MRGRLEPQGDAWKEEKCFRLKTGMGLQDRAVPGGAALLFYKEEEASCSVILMSGVLQEKRMKMKHGRSRLLLRMRCQLFFFFAILSLPSQ